MGGKTAARHTVYEVASITPLSGAVYTYDGGWWAWESSQKALKDCDSRGYTGASAEQQGCDDTVGETPGAMKEATALPMRPSRFRPYKEPSAERPSAIIPHPARGATASMLRFHTRSVAVGGHCDVHLA